MINNRYTLFAIYTVLLMLLAPIPALADGLNAKQQKEADEAYEAYFNAISFLDCEQQLHCADSLNQVGRMQKNYMVQIYGAILKAHAQFESGNQEKNLEALSTWKTLAMENNDRQSYYEAMQAECHYTFEYDPAMSAHLAKEMIEEANREQNITGQVYGYKTLGDIYSWRGQSDMAIREYELALEACRGTSIANLPLNYIYISAAQECYNVHKLDRALELLHEAEELCSKVDPAQLTSINFLHALIAYDQKKSNEDFFQLYETVTSDPYYEERIDPIMQQQLQVFWLIRKGQGHQALKLAEQIPDRAMQLSMRKECMEAIGDYRGANALSDSLIDLNDTLALQAQREDMDLLDKQIGNTQLKQRNDALKRHRLILGFSLGGALLLVITGGVIYINRRQRKHNAILSEKNVQLKKANDAKTHFIQNMTHELHTPINAINGFSSMLADPNMAPLFGPEDIAEMNKGIADSAISLTHIIDDIVALTDYETPTERPIIRPYTPQQTVDEAIRACASVDAAKVNLHTDFSLLPEGFQLNGNAGHDKRVLTNLIGNAIKFTDQGEITIGAYADEQKDRFVYYVQDTGSGIPEGKDEFIFQRFSKLNEYIPGTGLGLPVARIIARMLDGDVTLDREHTREGEGSRFLYTLPLHAEIFEGTGEKFSYNAHLGSY